MHRLGMLSVGNEGETEIGREEARGMREGRRLVLTPVLTPVVALMFVMSLQEEDGRTDGLWG